jgi:hypothetical protein
MTVFSFEISEHEGKEMRTDKKICVNQTEMYLFPLLSVSTMKDDKEVYTK